MFAEAACALPLRLPDKVAEAVAVIRRFYPGAYFDLDSRLGSPPVLVAYWERDGKEVLIGKVG